VSPATTSTKSPTQAKNPTRVPTRILCKRSTLAPKLRTTNAPVPPVLQCPT
jgi:hypothetical protein